ncbi:hypothetical protein SprV_0501903700 [Sparganum proliferum]
MWMNECLACPSAQSAGVDAWMRHLAEAHVMPTEWISERAARLVGPAARTPYTVITESKKKRCRGSVPRPLNSFMVSFSNALHHHHHYLQAYLPACLPATSLTHSTHQQLYPPPHPPPPAVAADAAALPVCHISLFLRQFFLHPVLQIFAQHIRRNVLRVFGKASNSIISRQLGEIWRSLPRPVKERYDAEAARLVKIHQIEFPDYKYQPKKKTAAAAASASTNQLSEAHRKRAATMPSVNQLISHATRLPSLSVPVTERTLHEHRFADWYSSPNINMTSQHTSGEVCSPSGSPGSSFCESSLITPELYTPLCAAEPDSPVNQNLQHNASSAVYSLPDLQQRQRYLSAENGDSVQRPQYQKQMFVMQHQHGTFRSASFSYPLSQNMKPDQMGVQQCTPFSCLPCTQQSSYAQKDGFSCSLSEPLARSRGSEQVEVLPQLPFKQPLEEGAFREDVTGIVEQTGYVPSGAGQLATGRWDTYSERACQDCADQELCSPSFWYPDRPPSPLKTPDSGYFDSGHSQWSSVPGTLSPVPDVKTDWSVFG